MANVKLKTIKFPDIDNTYIIQKYDDLQNVIKISTIGTTLGDVNTILTSVNSAGDHVFFDVSALGAQMYLCTIFIDTSENVYKIVDLVKGRVAEGTYDSNMLLTMAIALASDVATQSQVDYLQAEIDELGGKSVLTNWDALGDMILAGTSTDVVDAGDIVSINWMKTVLGTTASGLTVSCSNMDTFANGVGEAEAKDYLFVYDGTNWTYGGEVITLSDFGLTVTGSPSAGEVMTIKTTVESKDFTFTGYDDVEPVNGNVTHNWLLEETYAPLTKAYDTYESLFCIQAGKSVASGKYYIPMYSYRSGKTFNACFELTASLGGADKVQLNRNASGSANITDATGATISGVYAVTSLAPIVYGTTTSAGTAVAVTYLSNTDVTSGGYTLLTSLNVDADDPVVVVGDFDKSALGSNTWAYSNIRAWLNDDSKSGNYTPSHENDIASSYNRTQGYLFGIDPRVKALIQTAKVKWTAGYGNADFTQGTTYTSEDNVFLLSMKEMSFDINTNEGNISDLYGEYTNNTLTNGEVASRAKYNKVGGTLNSYRWSRSAYASYANISRYVTSTGSNGNYFANYAYSYAPAFIIGKASS